MRLRPLIALLALSCGLASAGPADARVAQVAPDPGGLRNEVVRIDDGVPAAASAGASSTSSRALARADLPLAWEVTKGAPGVVVAVVDTGVEADHPALRGRVLPGHDFVNGDDDASDDNGHGTAVAGIVASAEVVPGIAGACTECRILPVKVLGADGTGSWGTIAAGVVWAVDHGAQVVNLSIGAPRAPDAIGGAVAYAISKGVIVVAAAGNAGIDQSFYPAAYPGVVSVAGVDDANARYPWSNFGPWVTLTAPGCLGTTWIGAQYRTDFCGTSAAAPFVAGIAGLARAFRPDLGADAFAGAFAASATPLADGSTARAGLVNANALLVSLGAPSAAPAAVAPPSLARAPVVGRPVAVKGGAWRDAASVTYRWQRSRAGAVWQDLGAAADYTPRAGDAGFRLRVAVSAVNARGTATVVSAPSAPVAAPAGRTHRRG